jgi:malate permease and related proteins
MTSQIIQILLEAVFPVLVVITVGFLFSKARELDIKSIVDFVIYISIPCLIVRSLMSHPPSLDDAGILVGSNILIVGLTLLITKTALSRGIIKSRSAPITASFANSINLPIPLALFAFGPEVVSRQVVYASSNLFLLYSVGAWAASGKSNGFKVALKLPPVYGVIIGVTLSQIGFEPPQALWRPVSLLGDAAVPLLLFTAGYQLARLKITKLREALIPLALRWGVGISLAVTIIILTSPSREVGAALMLGASMPPAVQSYMLCVKFDADPEIAASTVVLGTLLSFIFLPILIPGIVVFL